MPITLEDIGQVHDTEVLILGSGAAGCGAALAATEACARVMLVDKGKLESSGCLGGGNDHFMAILDTDPVTDTTDVAVDFFAVPASGFSRSMVRQWIETIPRMLRYLEDMGVEFIHNPDGSYLRTEGFGQPGSWFINIANGHRIKRRVGRKIRSLGVDVVDNVMITKLLVAQGRAVGALGYDIRDGAFHIFRAKAVVMALGNSANRATTNSSGNPFNTWHSPFNTGSQYALAFEAGARLVSLDLRQQATLIPKGFGCAGMNGINSSGAFELNALGERFMGRYHPKLENGPRREQIQATHQEQCVGNGPPFHMDMRHIDADILRHLQYTLMPGDKATFLDYCEQRDVDFATRLMEVELSEIELSGMIDCDDTFESSLPGLFIGCVFSTFSGATCSGYIAGRSAAAAAAAEREPVAIDPGQAASERERVLAPLTVTNGLPYQRFETAIRQVMNYYMGYVRNGVGMEIALDRLALIGSRKETISAANHHELMRANEAKHLLTTCRLATLATLERRESGRSIYRRSDYPHKDPALARVLALENDHGEPRLKWL